MNLHNLTVAVLFGGPSGEHEVSCISAFTIVKNLLENNYKVFPIAVSKEGKWYGPIQLEEIKSFDASKHADKTLILPQQPGKKVFNESTGEVLAEIDVVFPIIHGSYGEDGHVQALLDMCRIPYVGAGVGGSVVGMDKVFMRDIFVAHDIPQTAYLAVRRHDFEEDTEAILNRIEAQLEYPMFVKPASLGSSVGISRVENREELAKGLVLASRYDYKLLVEKGLVVREIETAVLGNYEVEIAEPGEIVTGETFYDYEAKYVLDNSESIIPAPISETHKAQIKELAKKAYEVLDLSGLCRVDFFIDTEKDVVLLNEVNTLPGFTDISMYAKMWANNGRPLIEIVEKLLQLAIERHQDMMRNYSVLGGNV